jgi:lipoprotein LprG
MSRTLRAAAALSILAIVLTGCSKKSESSLPPGSQLMTEGANAMSDVKTAHFVLTVDGAITGLSLSKAEGDLTKEGNAKGTATIEQSGIKVEAAFVIVDQWLYLKLATGGYQKLPLAVAATVYDPSAILDPQRGAAQLLRTAKNPKTEALEKVDGKDAYKVTFDPDPTALAALIPTNASGVTATVWLYADSKKIAKAQFVIPTSGSAGKGTVTVVFSNYDAAVSISAPQ